MAVIIGAQSYVLLLPAKFQTAYDCGPMTPGRNDPCPCNSGKKYKRCCGAVIPIQSPTAITPLQLTPTTTRQCGECAACCGGPIVATIYGHEMKPGHPCHFLRDSACTIYEERPVVCQNFVCGWLSPKSLFPEDFRPDKLGVIIVNVQWRGKLAYILRAAGRDPDEALLNWMRNFSVRTGQPFFYEQNGEKLGFGPLEFQRDMVLRAQRGEPMW